MKTKDKIKSDKTVVEQLREIRDKLNIEVKDISVEQLMEYLSKQKTLHPTGIWKTVS